jgi:hypothetical protein
MEPMSFPSNPSIVSVERIATGLVIEFDDGRTAVFSAALLYASLAKAREISPNFVDIED